MTNRAHLSKTMGYVPPLGSIYGLWNRIYQFFDFVFLMSHSFSSSYKLPLSPPVTKKSTLLPEKVTMIWPNFLISKTPNSRFCHTFRGPTYIGLTPALEGVSGSIWNWILKIYQKFLYLQSKINQVIGDNHDIISFIILYDHGRQNINF